MPIRCKLASFTRLKGADRLIVLAAILILGLAGIAVLTVAFRVFKDWLSRVPDGGGRDAALIRRVRNAITIAAGNVPWNAVWLPQAMAATTVLARRGYDSVFHLGTMLERDGKLSAHAWLTARDVEVVGARGTRGMSHLARFC